MDHGFLVPVVRGQGGDRGGSFVCGRQRDGNFDLKKVHGFWKEVGRSLICMSTKITSSLWGPKCTVRTL